MDISEEKMGKAVYTLIQDLQEIALCSIKVIDRAERRFRSASCVHERKKPR